jgi:PAS domain S-box-containing protein
MAGLERESPGEGRTAPLERLWPVALFLLVAATIAGTAASVMTLRDAAEAQEILLDREVDALLLVRETQVESQARTRLAHAALLTGSSSSRAAAVAAYEQVHSQLRRLRRFQGGPDEEALLQTLEELQARSGAIWDELIAARQRGEPVGPLAQRYEAELQPLRAQLDEGYEALVALHDAQLTRGRAAVAARSRSAIQGLVAAAAVGIVLAIAMIAVARRSLRALARSEARYRATFEHAAIGIAHLALDGRWLRLNDRFAQIIGYDEQELRLLTFRDVTHPDDVEADERLVDALLRGDARVYGIEKRFVHRDGTTAWANVTVSMVRDGAGKPRYFIAAAEDIAARKAVEQDLRDAVRARDEFLHIASHELRTPLTSLRLQLESLRGAVGRPFEPERLGAKAESALRQTARLAMLVDGLLDVSRLADGEVRLEPEDADLAEAIRVLVRRFGSDAEKAGSELRLSADEPVRARFDLGRIDQAVTHLLANALKYGAGKPVDVTVRGDGAVARVVVRDRGIGIDARERERIFGRFERAVSSRHYGGLGLGLFLARRAVEAHGGTIFVESAPGVGSTFTIELPVAGPRAVAARTPSASSS